MQKNNQKLIWVIKTWYKKQTKQNKNKKKKKKKKKNLTMEVSFYWVMVYILHI